MEKPFNVITTENFRDKLTHLLRAGSFYSDFNKLLKQYSLTMKYEKTTDAKSSSKGEHVYLVDIDLVP